MTRGKGVKAHWFSRPVFSLHSIDVLRELGWPVPQFNRAIDGLLRRQLLYRLGGIGDAESFTAGLA